jgi:hypothetical protein
LDEAQSLCDKTGERFWEAEIVRLRGELLSQDAAASSSEYFRRARDVAQKQHSRSLELRAATSLGRSYQQQGNEAEAKQLIDETIATLTEGLEMPDVKDAQAMLKELRGFSA